MELKQNNYPTIIHQCNTTSYQAAEILVVDIKACSKPMNEQYATAICTPIFVHIIKELGIVQKRDLKVLYV